MPLRLVIFTTPGLSSYNDVLFRRLLADPDFEVAAIVVDDHPWKTQSLLKRLQRHGAGYALDLLRRKLTAPLERLLWSAWERQHPRRAGASYERLARETGVTIHRTPDIHRAETLDYIRGLGAELGIICGGRIIREAVLTIPARGTLNIHKRKVPDYRGGGAIGYWELQAGEQEIAVTIHQAVAKVDEGAVLAQQPIPIEAGDTLASLAIKAGVVGGNLYYETLKRLARGPLEPIPQDLTCGKTYRSAGPYAEAQYEEELRARQRGLYARFGMGRDYYAQPSTWLKFILTFPALMRRRLELCAAGQAPITVLFWHRVANDGANPGTLPLEVFVEQVELIRRYAEIISLEEACRRLASGRNEAPAVVLTFDDGYAADLATSIPWLRYFGIPATWFISVGNTLEGRSYNHDERRGIASARPMTPEELRGLEDGVIRVGCHSWLHDHCGELDADGLRRALVESKHALAELLGHAPETFAFPKGIKGVHITQPGWELAAREYTAVCSAYGGHNFPVAQSAAEMAGAPAAAPALHIKRFGNPLTVHGVLPILAGYTGLGALRHRDRLWSWSTRAERPY